MKSDGSKCQIKVGPFFQCCCKCIYHLPVHHHCGTDPKPKVKTYGRCVCGVQKGFACVAPEMGRVYDNWPRHSCGCELFTTKKEAAKWARHRKKADDLLIKTEHPNAPRFEVIAKTKEAL